MPSRDEDLNEQVLREMREGGDDLSTVRPVYFQFVFPSQEAAGRFAQALASSSVQVEVDEDGDGPVEELPWDVNVMIEIQPELASISRHERELGAISTENEGRADGWFCERIKSREA